MDKEILDFSHQHNRQLAGIARERIELHRDSESALEIISRITDCDVTSLVTSMMIVQLEHANPELQEKATDAFKLLVDRCDQGAALTGPVNWIRNPANGFTDVGFESMLAKKRKALDPAWDGVWEDTGPKGGILARELKNADPIEVGDPEICLDMAAQLRDWQPWMERYVSLQGDQDNPKYLKIYISKFVRTRNAVPDGVQQMLQRYIRVGDVSKVKSYLKNIMPTKPSSSGVPYNRILSETAMHILLSDQRFELTKADWVHVAEAALYMGDDDVQRMVLRALSEIERSPLIQAAFNKLIQRHGPPNPYVSAREDLESAIKNPIWDRLSTSTPVNASARTILSRYSESWLD